MGTVLFAWELGGGLGHVGPMKVLAEQLIRWGHQCVFAVKDVISARTVLGNLGPIVQAPQLRRIRDADLAFGAGSFTDILAIRGFGEPAILGAAVDAWSDLFDLVRPDLLVADFSPTAVLAAYARLPIVVVGYGFYVPPDHLAKFPVFRDDVPPVLGENTVLASVQNVLGERARGAPKTLPSSFRAQYTHIYSLPSLDQYGDFRLTPGFGPIEEMPEPTPLPQDHRVFAYLAPDYPRISDVVVALGELGCPVEAFFRGGEPYISRFAARRGLTVHAKAPALSEILPRSSIVVSHGGGGIAHAAMLGARPQLLLARHAEGHGTAIMLARRGVARRLNTDHGPQAVRESVKAALMNPALSAAAHEAAIAARAVYFPRSRLEGLIEACNELVYASRGKSGQAKKPQRVTSIP